MTGDQRHRAPVTATALPRPRLQRLRAGAWRLVVLTLGACFRHRVTGLAAEAAFFTILSLPPLIFGLVGATGFVARTFDVRTVASFRDQILALAARVLTRDAVSTVIQPTLDDVLSGGRFSVISIGFLLALWSGSRALNVFVDTITIMYGLAGRRSMVKTRALSFGLYVVFLVVSTVAIPLVLAGPGLVDQLLPRGLDALGALYWPVVLLSSVIFLVALYHLATPVRTRWRADLPGAALTLVFWVAGSVVLRLVLSASSGSSTIYGPLAAPIAVLVWLYLISIAVLVGAAFNAALDQVWPRLSGIEHPDRAAADEPSVTPSTGRVHRGRWWRARPPRSASRDSDTVLKE
ncbi:YihY/virulence factor BrkB family protein [uncultured Friedmanniella sp.]|uniref:YihY/virulence factor BrkB family protein n=1 Tax=uncultured Friedmanniella sp. TaxID=335381 RepID=UPI0035C965B7